MASFLCRAASDRDCSFVLPLSAPRKGRETPLERSRRQLGLYSPKGFQTQTPAVTTSERCSTKSAPLHDESTCLGGARCSLWSRPCTLQLPTQIGSDCGAPSSDVGAESALVTAPPRIGSARRIRAVFSCLLLTVRRRSYTYALTPMDILPTWCPVSSNLLYSSEAGSFVLSLCPDATS